MKTIIALVFFIGLNSTAFPSESEFVKNNLAHEYSSCATYYLLMAEMPGLLQEIIDKYDSIGSFLFTRAAGLTSPELTYAMAEHEKTKIKKLSREAGTIFLLCAKNMRTDVRYWSKGLKRDLNIGVIKRLINKPIFIKVPYNTYLKRTGQQRCVPKRSVVLKGLYAAA